MRKKWTLALITAVMAISLSACGNNSPAATENASSNEKSSGGNETQKTVNTGYPSKSFTVVVPNSAGGGNDAAARTMSKLLGELGLVSQSLSIQNKPGGGQAVGMAEFVKHKGDYSIYVASPPTIINNLRKEGNSPYGISDVTPLGRIYNDIAILAVSADSKYKDLQSFIADLKAKPSDITIVGGSGPGSQDHLTVMLLADKSGIDPKKIKYIGYDGSGDALTSLLGNNGDALTSDLSGITEFVKAGKVRILAVAAEERLQGDLKDVPTYKEQGVDLVYYNWRGVFGPKDMSPEAIEFWNKSLKTLTESPEFSKEISVSGFIPGYMNSTEFIAYLEEQSNMFKDILAKLDMLK
jgi:putative tricarboxylic transport membrane protein